MKNIDELIELNTLDPISRYLKVTCEENDQIKDLTIKILFSLKAIDLAIQNNCNTSYHFYIKSDTTIYNLLCNIYDSEKIERRDFDKAMFILDFCKLIYRFTCAKKFKEENPDIFQLRLNSWGRDYVEFHIKNKNRDYDITKEYVELYLKNNILTYIELTLMLLGNLNNEQLIAIDKLNSKVDIELLS